MRTSASRARRRRSTNAVSASAGVTNVGGAELRQRRQLLQTFDKTEAGFDVQDRQVWQALQRLEAPFERQTPRQVQILQFQEMLEWLQTAPEAHTVGEVQVLERAVQVGEDLQRHAGDRFVARQVDLNELSARPQSLREEQVPLVCIRPGNVSQLEHLRGRHHGTKRLFELLDQNWSFTAVLPMMSSLNCAGSTGNRRSRLRTCSYNQHKLQFDWWFGRPLAM